MNEIGPERRPEHPASVGTLDASLLDKEEMIQMASTTEQSIMSLALSKVRATIERDEADQMIEMLLTDIDLDHAEKKRVVRKVLRNFKAVLSEDAGTRLEAFLKFKNVAIRNLAFKLESEKGELDTHEVQSLVPDSEEISNREIKSLQAVLMGSRLTQEAREQLLNIISSHNTSSPQSA